MTIQHIPEAEVVFPMITRFLNRKDEARWSRVDQAHHHDATNVRLATKHIELSGLPYVTDNQLPQVLSQYPNFNSLHLNCARMSKVSIARLGAAIQNKQMVGIDISNNPGEKKFPELDPVIFKEFIERINFSGLKKLNISQLRDSFSWDSPPKSIPFDLLLEKIKQGQSLKALQLYPDAEPYSQEQSSQLAEHLPNSMETVGFNQLQVTDRVLDLFMNRFDQNKIIACELQLTEEVTPQKLREFLEFLPLSKMTKISITGSALTNENLNYLASEIKENMNLEVFFVKNLPRNLMVQTSINLMNSLNSTYLKEIYIDRMLIFNLDEPPEIRYVIKRNKGFDEILREKLEFWKNLKTFTIDSVDTRPFPLSTRARLGLLFIVAFSVELYFLKSYPEFFRHENKYIQ